MAIKLRTRFSLLFAKLQEAEAEVAEKAVAARAALRELAAVEAEADKLDDRIGDLIGLRLAHYSDRLEIANSGGSTFDTSEGVDQLKSVAGEARRWVAASRLVNVDKLFRALGVDEDDAPDEDDEDDDDAPDEDDGSAALEHIPDELEEES
jgi:hypothetical protein